MTTITGTPAVAGPASTAATTTASATDATTKADTTESTDTTTASTAGTSTTATSSTTKTKQADETGLGLDKDAFLKILVEQLRHQNPAQPGDSQQYIQQMTQYSMLEQLNNISTAVQGQKLDTANTTALNLVGHAIKWKDAEGEHSGVVDKVDFSKDGATLTVGDASGIELSTVTEVR